MTDAKLSLSAILLLSSDGSSEKVAVATAGVSTLSSAKTGDPLTILAKQLGGSKRNALLRWCQNRTATYTVTALAEMASESLLFSSVVLR